MLYAWRWLRRYPELLLVLLGIWLAVAVATLEWCVLSFDWKTKRGTVLDDLMRTLWHLPHAQKVANVTLATGLVVALAALLLAALKMVRRRRAAGWHRSQQSA